MGEENLLRERLEVVAGCAGRNSRWGGRGSSGVSAGEEGLRASDGPGGNSESIIQKEEGRKGRELTKQTRLNRRQYLSRGKEDIFKEKLQNGKNVFDK